MNDDHDAERDHERDLDLASASLDGVATADERALVEADPVLITLVERLAAIRRAVADVAPPSERAREQALAAALATFDGAAADHDADAGPAETGVIAPLPPHHRWRWRHGLSVAAAAIVVVAGGIAVLRDDAEAPTASRQATVTSTVLSPAAAAPATATGVAPTVAAVPTVPTDAADAAADAVSAPIEAESAGAGTAPSLEMSAAEPAAPAPAGAAAQLELLEGSDDLRAFALTLEAPPSLAEKAAACDPAGPAEAPDALFVTADGVDHRVVVVRLGGGEFGAIDVETCDIVAETAPRD